MARTHLTIAAQRALRADLIGASDYTPPVAIRMSGLLPVLIGTHAVAQLWRARPRRSGEAGV